MAESKYELWQRKIRNGKRKQKEKEEREMLATFDALKKDYNKTFAFDIEATPINAQSRKLPDGWTMETTADLEYFQEQLAKALKVPKHLLK